MSCISSNFSSFFLNSLNDPSEFAKYLSNGELKFSSFEDFQQQQQYLNTQQQQQMNGVVVSAAGGNDIIYDASNYSPHAAQQQQQHYVTSHTQSQTPSNGNYAHQAAQQHLHHQQSTHNATTSTLHPAATPNTNSGAPNTPHYAHNSQRWPTAVATPGGGSATTHTQHAGGAQHFDGSFEFIKYLRHSNDYSSESSSENSNAPTLAAPNANGAQSPNSPAAASAASSSPATAAGGGVPSTQQNQSSLIDLDTSTSHKPRSASRKVAALLSSVSRASNSLDATTLDVFDHDSKQTIFDLQHMTTSSNSNESSLEMSNLAFPNSHLNASNSNTSSEGAAAGSSDFSLLSANSSAPKLLATFAIKENFDVHPSHKVEEGIFQHMNKLPTKKKENLKQLGVRFTGQMTLSDKSTVVENFIRFCQEYDIKDHRPFLSLNQSGLNKPEQIKFARYLGQGLPTFTLFCIYSNFKNLFCTKRTEIYTKDGYNLPYILDKTKRFLSNTTAGNTPVKNQSATQSTTPPPQTQQQQQQSITTQAQEQTTQQQQQQATIQTTAVPATIQTMPSNVPMQIPARIMTPNAVNTTTTTIATAQPNQPTRTMTPTTMALNASPMTPPPPLHQQQQQLQQQQLQQQHLQLQQHHQQQQHLQHQQHLHAQQQLQQQQHHHHPHTHHPHHQQQHHMPPHTPISAMMQHVTHAAHSPLQQQQQQQATPTQHLLAMTVGTSPVIGGGGGGGGGVIFPLQTHAPPMSMTMGPNM